MLKNGFIILDRSILNWEWYDDINTKIVFIHLLLTVSIKDHNWHGMTIKRGSRVSSYAALADELHLSVRNVRTSINHLESTGEVTRCAHAKYTVFTVNNYDKYQTVTSKPTNNRQTDDKQPTNNRQQYNNINNINNINPPTPLEKGEGVSFEIFFSEYPKKTDRERAERVFERKHFNQDQFDWMMRVLKEDKDSEQWRKENGRYIPKAYNWLENEMYNRKLKNAKMRIFSSDPYPE